MLFVFFRSDIAIKNGITFCDAEKFLDALDKLFHKKCF